MNGPKSLADRDRHHEMAKSNVSPSSVGAAHGQHLLRRHQEHVPGPQQHGEAEQMRDRQRPCPKAEGGEQHQRAADPGGAGIVAAVDVAADLHGDEDRHQRKARGDHAKPDHRQAEFDRTVGHGDPQNPDDGVSNHHVGEQRRQQLPVDIAGGSGRGCFLRHQTIVRSTRTQRRAGRLVVLHSGRRRRCKDGQTHGRHACRHRATHPRPFPRRVNVSAWGYRRRRSRTDLAAATAARRQASRLQAHTNAGPARRLISWSESISRSRQI